MEVREGTVLDGRYLLRTVLGDGATATVWRATDERLGRDVAVKVVRPGALDATGRQRARAESLALARCTHPGLVAIYDAKMTDDPAAACYVVLELVDGRSLRDALADGPLDPPEAARIGAAVAAALGYLHDHGVVHRDIKPANVLLGPDGMVKLADLGIARFADATRLTGTGLLVGTPAYLAPEQVDGGPVTSAADVYALGLVLLECLTGAKAYDGSGLEGALARLHRDPVIPSELPDGWRSALAAMLRRGPDARVASAAVPLLLADLEHATTRGATAVLPAADLETAPLPEPVAPVEAAGSTTPRRFAIFGIGAAALALVIALASTGGGSQRRPTVPAASPTPATHSVAPVAVVPPTTTAPRTHVPPPAAPAPPPKHEHDHGHGDPKRHG